MREIKLKLLTDKLFLLGLIGLLANDLILKYEFSGLITGKLSDIFGLFTFPFFWGVLFERHRLKVYIVTIAGFVFWKLPLSTDLIAGVNQFLGARFNRVTDYSDLIAILITPYSYKYLTGKIRAYEPETKLHLAPILVCIISLFAFVATTLPRQEVRKKLVVNEKIICNMEKGEIFKTRIKAGKPLSENLKSNLSDSLFLIHFRLDEYNARVETWIKIYSIDSAHTVFEVESLDSYTVFGRLIFGIDQKNVDHLRTLTKDELRNLIKTKVIDKIEDKNVIDPQIYFDNARLDPELKDRRLKKSRL